MSTEYIALGFETCLNEEGIAATPEQIARMAHRFHLGMSVMDEATGVIEQTKSGAPQKSPEQLRIEKLERIVLGLSRRLGVSVDERTEEMIFYTPVGTSHVGTTRARL
jgi:hypothetical protein